MLLKWKAVNNERASLKACVFTFWRVTAVARRGQIHHLQTNKARVFPPQTPKTEGKEGKRKTTLKHQSV